MKLNKIHYYKEQHECLHTARPLQCLRNNTVGVYSAPRCFTCCALSRHHSTPPLLYFILIVLPFSNWTHPSWLCIVLPRFITLLSVELALAFYFSRISQLWSRALLTCCYTPFNTAKLVLNDCLGFDVKIILLTYLIYIYIYLFA